MSSRPIDMPVMHPEALWDLGAIMAYARYGESQARKIVADPDFPQPVRVLGESSDPRWFAGEVWAFVRSKRPNPAS